MMKAIRVSQYGGPEVLKVLETAIPKPKGKEVLVCVKAAGVNPVDTYIRAGAYAVVPDLPYTPGKDGAGVVQETGEGVTQLKVGDRVWFGSTSTGSYAEYALCEEKGAKKLPDGITFEQGAALGIPYLTAHRALFHKCKAKAGESVLIHGASGGVGVAAAQFALANGLTVLGTAGSEDGATILKSIGVQKVFNHRKDGYLKEIEDSTHGKGVDIILEMLANVNLSNDFKLLGLYGRLAIIGSRGPIEIAPRDMMGKELSVFGVALASSSKKELEDSYAATQDALVNGKLNPIVGLKYSLEDAHVAHQEIIETKAAKGKMVLVPSKM